MRLAVKVTPGSKKPGIQRASDGALVVKVREPAADGRANDAVVEALAGHFGVPKSAITIVHGRASRRKLIELAS
jgi:hypothetical protein